jgi:Flp pilus assembly protein TadG
MSKSGKIFSHRKEHGQSMVEVALTLPFLLVIILALVEMGILFASYIALVNATREGAIYSSMHPELSDSSKTPAVTTQNQNTVWEIYQNRVIDEVSVAVGNKLYEGQLADAPNLVVDRPVLGPTSTQCPNRNDMGCPITTTVHYQIHTFLSDASLPAFGRFGLPSTYRIDYSMSMPIR